MNTTIYFVRHSAYENPGRIVPGRVPGYHLSSEGVKKAKKLGEFFKDKPISHVYTSPLERAYETANIIAQYHKKLQITHAIELTEVDSIHWQAYKLEELYTNNYYEAFLNDPHTDEVPENTFSLAQRMKKFTLSLCKKHQGEEIICVSHEFPIAALLLSLQGKPLQLIKTYYLTMASVTRLVFGQDCELRETDLLTKI